MFRRLVLLLTAASAYAAVTGVQVLERSDYLEGKSFGAAGPYEEIRAKVFFDADPALPQNRIIVDLNLAPKNEQGRVEWSADMVLLKPRDPARGNGTLLFEVSNRGRLGMLGMFNRPEGEPYLMTQGYTLLWCGWQWDIPESAREGLRLYAPIATDGGKPIRGLVRAEWVPPASAQKMWLGDRNHVPYPVVADAKLTVRNSGDGERQPIPASAWKLVDEGRAIEMTAGFAPGRVYELVYTSENPRVSGLGPASVRDVVSFFKNRGGGGLHLTEQFRYVKRAIGFGTSQSGRFLRKFLYDGFNTDEKGRKVFDGVWAHVAGAGRGSFNHRFAQASRDGHPMMNFYYPSDLAPFTDEGLLKRAVADKSAPRIFYTDGSYEYWGRASALTHVTEDGGADAPLAPDSRRYYLAGTQHGAGQFPPRKTAATEYAANANDYRFTMRALLKAFNAWLTDGTEPPKSMYPTLAAGQLVPFDKLRIPLAGVKTPAVPHRAWRVDYGAEFAASGIVTKEPPEAGPAFPVLVPQVDANGNELGGVRTPQLAAPLATYTGWNYRTKEIGAQGQIFDMVGSTFPFPKAKVAQLYRDKRDYLDKTQAAARDLAKGGYLLEDDIPEVLTRAAAQWDGFGSAETTRSR